MSGQLNELRLQVERLNYDSKESGITIDILKEQNDDAKAELEELKKTISDLRSSQKDASADDKEKRKQEKMAMMMAKFDTVSFLLVDSKFPIGAVICPRSVRVSVLPLSTIEILHPTLCPLASSALAAVMPVTTPVPFVPPLSSHQTILQLHPLTICMHSPSFFMTKNSKGPFQKKMSSCARFWPNLMRSTTKVVCRVSL